MTSLLLSRRISTLIALLFFSVFTTVQAANDGTLGTWTAKNLSPNNDIMGMAFCNNTYVTPSAVPENKYADKAAKCLDIVVDAEGVAKKIGVQVYSFTE